VTARKKVRDIFVSFPNHGSVPSIISDTGGWDLWPASLIFVLNGAMITIVSGLPRSGTSLMMQMLAAGGLPILSDGERKSDTDNPRGYLEWERIKQLPKDPGCIAESEGKVVKVISQLLLLLPAGHDYRVIFMQRPLAEVLKSQDEMLARRGNYVAGQDMSPIEKAFERHLQAVDKWIAERTNIAVLRMQYHHILRDPRTVSEEIASFLKVPLDVEAMTRQVDANLYRNRTS
jgi:hypothetical protein